MTSCGAVCGSWFESLRHFFLGIRIEVIQLRHQLRLSRASGAPRTSGPPGLEGRNPACQIKDRNPVAFQVKVNRAFLLEQVCLKHCIGHAYNTEIITGSRCTAQETLSDTAVTLCGDRRSLDLGGSSHFARYVNVESLHCAPKTNVTYCTSTVL